MGYSSSRPSNLHRRLTVALASADDRGQVVEALVAALGEDAPAGPVRAADLLRAADALARLHAGERSALRSRLEATAAQARDALTSATQARDALVAKRDGLLSGAAWARTSPAELARLREAFDAARAGLDDRAAGLRNAQSALARVLEQRAAAAATVEAVDEELADVAGAGLDERGLRQELGLAGRSVRTAAIELQEATSALESLDAERLALVTERAEIAPAGEADPQAAARAEDLDRLVEALGVYTQHASLASPDPVAAELALAWSDLSADMAEAGMPTGPQPSEADLREAASRAAAAAAHLHRVEQERAGRRLSAEQLAGVEAVHAEVLAAEERAGARRLGAGAARRELEEARAAELELLRSIGFNSYLEVVLSGGSAGATDPVLEDAERRYLSATSALEELRRASHLTPTLAHLASERDRLRAHAAQVLGVDPGSDVVSLLRAHPGVPSRLVDQLREALAGLGVRPVGVALDEAARAWLAEHGPTSGPAEGDAGAARAERLAEIDARIDELDVLRAPAVRRVAYAAEAMELAQRSVDACQAELTSRSGEDTKRLKRIAVAEQLRAQVDTLERALADAEASARSALEDALSGHADAEVAYERAGSAVNALARRARALAQELPAERRPTDDPILAMLDVADELEALAGAMSADVARSDAAVDAAAQEHREADAAHRMASQMARGPQHDDFLEALTHLLEGHQGEVLVLDDPLSAVGSGPREDLLQLIAAGSANRPLILLTDDPDVLGWAIEQPADVAAAVPAGALVSDVTHLSSCAGPRAGRS